MNEHEYRERAKNGTNDGQLNKSMKISTANVRIEVGKAKGIEIEIGGKMTHCEIVAQPTTNYYHNLLHESFSRAHAFNSLPLRLENLFLPIFWRFLQCIGGQFTKAVASFY